MTVRRPTRAAVVTTSVLAALLAALAGCGARPAAAPTGAQVTVAVRMVVHTCGTRPRLVPIRAAVRLDGRGPKRRVTTGKRGSATVRLTPGRYAVAPLRPALRHAVVSARFDGTAVRASDGGPVVDITNGRHRVLLLVGLRPLECNGRAPAG
ncbi:MAG TPA: hypothetical protein VGQ45_00975 [Gaiellales bacterium]|jgi:hypothetical protein|nr:hypothetical protein [Gaiellales bacterium]